LDIKTLTPGQVHIQALDTNCRITNIDVVGSWRRNGRGHKRPSSDPTPLASVGTMSAFKSQNSEVFASLNPMTSFLRDATLSKAFVVSCFHGQVRVAEGGHVVERVM
jgi:hypothetical protein